MTKKTGEVSPGGSAILRHDARADAWSPPAETRALEEIVQHFARHVGEAATVLHEIVSDLVHIDVHVVAPRPDRRCWTLFTTGMSDLPMTVPAGAEEFAHAELVLSLPPEWPIAGVGAATTSVDAERWYWPIRWMKMLARMPHEYLGPWRHRTAGRFGSTRCSRCTRRR